MFEVLSICVAMASISCCSFFLGREFGIYKELENMFHSRMYVSWDQYGNKVEHFLCMDATDCIGAMSKSCGNS